MAALLPRDGKGDPDFAGRMRFRRAAAWIVVVLAVGSLYLWIARTGGSGFQWTYDLGGYYNYLTRGFTHGHLYVPIDPSPKLLALRDPWDPRVDDSIRMQDMAFFHGRYYLYHGVGPAVLLFLPWRLVTGHDLPESFALFLLCSGGFLFFSGAWLGLLELAGVKPGPVLTAGTLIALGTCQSIPYLLNRVWVYEIAIGGGYFCVGGAIFFLVRAVRSRFSSYWLAASGLMFGLAIACRPHLGLAGALALLGLLLAYGRSPRILIFLAPFVLVGLGVGVYNYARFGNPFEFGVRYLLTGENQHRIKLATEFVPPGLYFMLYCAPHFSPVFPWVTPAFRYPFDSVAHPFPKEYFIEPTVGVLYLAPFLAGILLIRKTRVRGALWLLVACGAATLLFIAATGFTSERYEADFLPVWILAALAAVGISMAQSAGWRRAVLGSVLALSVAFGAIVNLALGITGPYDDILKTRPKTWLRVARWFSPHQQYRPLLNPRIAVDFSAGFLPHEDGFREPLLTMGDRTYRHFLYAEHAGARVRLVSRCDASTVTQEIGRPGGPLQLQVRFAPESGKLSVAANGQELLVHEIKALLTAPWQVSVGENRIDPGVSVNRFTGPIRTLAQSIRPD